MRWSGKTLAKTIHLVMLKESQGIFMTKILCLVTLLAGSLATPLGCLALQETSLLSHSLSLD
jgi:hypothetical protein